MFPTGFLDKAYKKEKRENSKECGVSSENVKSLDLLREASRQAAGKPSREKVQQRDGGSSSEASKMVAIPEKFKWVGGNADLEEAQVILFAEAHLSQHNNDIVDCINAHAKDGDIVLVEGVQAGQELEKIEYAVNKANTLGDLTDDQWKQATMKQQDEFHFEIRKWCEQGVIRPFTKDVKIYGWDNMEALDEMFSSKGKYTELSKKSLQEKGRKLLYQIEMDKTWKEYFKSDHERDESMLKTINEMRNKFPDKRIFTIAGVDHVQNSHVQNSHVQNSLEKVKDQPYIALSPKYELTEKEIEGYERTNLGNGREENVMVK
jgi:hypothetical protein